MQYLRESEAVAEQVLEVFYNNSGETIQRGYPVGFDARTFADTDGVKVIQTQTGQEELLAGVAYEDILPGAYGRFQTGGFCDFALVVADAISAVSPGDRLKVVPGQWYLTRMGQGDGTGGLVTAMETIGASGVVNPVPRKVFLRCR